MQLYDHAGYRACGCNVNGLTGKEADHKLYAVGTDSDIIWFRTGYWETRLVGYTAKFEKTFDIIEP